MSYADETLDLRYLWRVLSRYRWVVVLNAVLVGAAAAAITKLALEPTYRAETTILLPSGSASPLSALLGSLGLSSMGEGGSGNSEILAVLRSRSSAEQVVRALGLQKEYEAPDEVVAATILKNNVSVNVGPEGQLIISASAKRARLAADIANAYPSILDTYRQSDDASAAQRNLRFVETQLLRTRVELEDAEKQLQRYQRRKGVISPESSTEETMRRLNSAESELAGLQITLREQRERLAALQPKLRERAQDPGAPAVANAGEVDRLRSKLAELQAEYLVDEFSYQPDHPRMAELRLSIDTTKSQLQEFVKRSLSTVEKGLMPELIDLQVGLVAGEARESALNAEIGRLKERAAQLPDTVMEFARLRRAVSAKESLYQMLQQELQKAQIAAARDVVPARVLDRATVPLVPSSPNLPRNIFLGIFAGLFLGIVLAFFLYAVSTPADPTTPTRRREVEPARRG